MFSQIDAHAIGMLDETVGVNRDALLFSNKINSLYHTLHTSKLIIILFRRRVTSFQKISQSQ